MSCDCNDIPNSAELLKSNFQPHEIRTMHSVMCCAEEHPSNALFRRIVMLMLRGHYATPLNYGEEFAHLGCYVWKDEDPTGTLKVDYTHKFNDKDPTMVPGVYVGFGGMNTTKLALGGGHNNHSEDNSVENFTRGATLVIEAHHLATSSPDAHDMAEMSYVFLMAMAAVIRNVTGAASFDVIGYGKATKNKLTTSETHYDVVLTVEISYTLSAALSEESHRLRKISAIIASGTN